MPAQGHPHDLTDMADVTVDHPEQGQVLVFDGREWVNLPPEKAGLAVVGHGHTGDDIRTALDIVQSASVCGVEGCDRLTGLTRIVVSLEPTVGAGLPFRFKKPIWEQEITICDFHLTPPDFVPPPDPLPPGWIPPSYRPGVASPEGIGVRLVWGGEIVT